MTLNRNLSVFLDLLRLFAALLVLIAHAGRIYQMHLPDLVAHSAKEGVVIFFALSGFVIAFVTTEKERDWRSFARARAVRMYSVVPLAIVVMAICYFLGSPLAPHLYGLSDAASGGTFGQAPNALGTLRYLTFTNEIWFDRSVISTGAPFWSLGFEVAYYAGFAVLCYGRGYWRWVLVLGWAALCGPRILLAFPLWLVGVAAWSLVRRYAGKAPTGGWIGLGVIVLLTLIWRKAAGGVAVPLFEWPAPGAVLASMGYYIVLAALTAALVVLFAACAPERRIWPKGFERAVRYCAGASFTLYIAHLPVMVLIAAIWPGSMTSTVSGLAATAATVIVMFGLAEFGERRKAAYARIFDISCEYLKGLGKSKVSTID